MRLAVCLFGNLGNALCAGARDPRVDLMKESVGFNDVSAPRSLLDKNLCSHYDTDFFLHSWSEPSKDFILELYNPKSYEITSQKHFDVDLEEYGLIGNDISEWKCSDSSKFGYEALLPSRGSVKNILSEMKRMSFRSSSRYYSSQQSIKLKEKYEKENNFKYDFVLLTRFDIVFNKMFNLETLDKTKFYGNFRYDSIDTDYAISDHWFLGGSENMNKFGMLFDYRHNYCLRPTFSSRQHIQKFIGDENLEHLLNDDEYYVHRP
jgi:hypothetical protein